MIAILGPPPIQFLKRSSETQRYWNDGGNLALRYAQPGRCRLILMDLGQWKALARVPQNSLENSENYLGGKEKEAFIRFIQKMLQWDPEKRQSARELLADPWLNTESQLDERKSCFPL